MEYSGTCDIVGDDDEKTILAARELVGFLPANCREMPPAGKTSDAPDRAVPELETLVPDDPGVSYDIHAVIAAIVDDGRVFEIKEGYAKNLDHLLLPLQRSGDRTGGIQPGGCPVP